MKIAGFGVPRFEGPNELSPGVIIEKINERMGKMGITAEQVVNIAVEPEVFHIFYRTE